MQLITYTSEERHSDAGRTDGTLGEGTGKCVCGAPRVSVQAS